MVPLGHASLKQVVYNISKLYRGIKSVTIIINGKTFYRTTEACQIAGITRNTLLRWIREGSFPDTENRDRRGWRLFTEDELEKLKNEVNKIIPKKQMAP